MRTRATWLRRAQLAGAALLALGAPLALLAGRASAASLSNGTVSINTIGTVTSGTPYSSGQQVNVVVSANPTLSLTNLESAGYTGEPAMRAVECDDPGGLVGNLPGTPTGNCDGSTILSTSAVNADGSFTIDNYTIDWLPDNATFGESPTQKPTCGTAPDFCVLYLGPAQNDFSKPHIFSAPFLVTNNGDDGGEDPGDGSAPTETTASPTKSTVVASPATAAADGISVSKVTVTLLYADGTPVTGGKEITLSQGSGSSSTIMYNGSVGFTGTTDTTTGAVSFTVSDTKAETVTYSATDVSDSDLVLTPTPAGNPTVTFNAPVVTPANSTITAVPTTVPSGTSTSITVTLDDQASPGVPVAGKAVTLSQGTGHSVITTVSGTTNAQGQAKFTATDTASEAVTYSATDTTDGIPLTGVSAVVTFGTLTVSPSVSTVTANPTVVSSVASGGVLPTGTVTVTLLASDGVSAVSGKTVTLSANSTHAVVTPSTGVATDSNGHATFSVADGTAESVAFTATDVTDSGLVMTHTATVDFEVPAPSATTSTVTVSVPTEIADGVTPVTIVVTMHDQFGNALGGVAVNVTGSPDATTEVAPQPEGSLAPGTTNNSGVATFYAYDTTAETVQYTAEDTTDSVTLGQTVSVTFVATAPQASNSTVAANPPVVANDGTTASTITVTLQDHNSNPVPGKAISLAAVAGSSKITPIDPTTNPHGEATFSVTDTANEIVAYTATDTTDNLFLAGQEATVTFGTPPPVAPVVADSTVVGSPTKVPADGSSAATITVVLSDADGDALSGKTVALNPEGGTSSVVTVTGVTNSDGEATFTVTDKAAESVTYDATDVTDNLPLSGQSVTVVFTTASGSSAAGGSGSSTTTTTTTTPSSAAATGAGATTATTVASATASDAATTGNTGSSGSSATPASASAGGSLALTGASDLLPWTLALGGILLGFGTIGRRRLTRRQPVVVRIGSERQ
ncbi:MAG: Ig-like domain-containing protein [Acidimicrobiales bacterium]